MNKMFVKNGELKVGNGGYLLTEDEKPANHQEFVAVQKQAELLVKLAEKTKGVNFKDVKGASLEELRRQVISECNTEKQLNLFEVPSKPNTEMIDSLTKEALSFVNFEKDKDKAAKLNRDVQQFKIIYDFENEGLYFEEDVVKLNRIYTIDEVKAALEIMYDLINS